MVLVFFWFYFMLQLCFDRFSLIINVVLLRSALEVIVPVSAEPTRAGFDFYTWWEKLPLTATPSSFCLIIGFSLLLFLFFSELWIVSEGLSFALRPSVLIHKHMHTQTFIHWCFSRVHGDTVHGMCQSFIIDQIQLPASDFRYLDIPLSFFLSQTQVAGECLCTLDFTWRHVVTDNCPQD